MTSFPPHINDQNISASLFEKKVYDWLNNQSAFLQSWTTPSYPSHSKTIQQSFTNQSKEGNIPSLILTITSANKRMASSPDRPTKRLRSQSPSHRMFDDYAPPVASTLQSTTIDVYEDDPFNVSSIALDDTPRPLQPRRVSNQPALHRSNYPLFSAGSVKSSSQHSLSSRSRSSSPNKSPSRRMGDFKLSDIDIEMVEFDTEGAPVPAQAQTLYGDLLKIEAGIHVLPAGVNLDGLPGSHLIRPDGISEDENIGGRRNDVFLSPSMTHTSDNSLIQEIYLDQITRLCKSAKECHNNKEPESAWNSEVHSTLLRLALQSRRKEDRVWYRDVTTAKIDKDEDLLPNNVKNLPLSSKMVDYAMILEENDDRIRSVLRAAASATINQTSAENVRFSPIAVSIETKRPGVGGDDANMQLSVWASAHFAKLRQLCGNVDRKMAGVPGVQLPTLPLILIQGHEWKLKLAHASMDRSIVILGDIRLGSTSTVVEIYKIIAALRRLAKWANEDMRRWFDDNVYDKLNI